MRSAIEAKDAHALAALYADEAVVEPIGGQPQHGRAAIEAAARAEMDPAESIRVAFSRMWIKGDLAVVEAVFHAKHPAASGLHDVGGTEISTMWFDRDGRIARERSYSEQASLESQAQGDADADPIPELPTTTEVHVARDTTHDAERIAWAQDMEAKNSASDEHTLATLADPFRWDCALGFHGSSRDAFAKALAGYRTRFPDEKWVATNVWPVEDYLIVEELFTGTHEGDMGPFKASHRPVQWHWLEIWQVKDAKIAHGWSWANFDELKSQIQLQPDNKRKPAAACLVQP
jgi:ketosteroid isomerase-like protein